MAFPLRTGRHGFTLIEMLIVIVIILIVSVAYLISSAPLKAMVDMETARTTVVRAVEQARNRAMTGAGTGNHGVYLTAHMIASFAGDTYDAATATPVALPDSVTASPAGTTIIFERLRGIPAPPATITLTHTNGQTASVQIRANGSIDVP